MSKLLAFHLNSLTTCALAVLMVGAVLVSQETYAAWKNICPPELLCTNSSISDDQFPFSTHFGNGDSFVLKSPRPYKDGSTQVIYVGQDLHAPTERVINLPVGNAHGTPSKFAYYERADGNRLYVNGALATAVDANDRTVATTNFVDVAAYGMMGISTPLTRVGSWQAIASIYFDGSGVLRSTNDDGNTWSSSTIPVKPIPGDSLYKSLFEGALWVVGSLPSGSTAIFATTNRGTSWTRVDDGAFVGQGGKFISLAFSTDPTAAGGHAVYATTTKGLVVSRDKGSSWTPVALPATEALTTVATVGSQTPNWIVVGTERRVLVSKDAGHSWSPLGLGLTESKQYVFVAAQRLLQETKRAGTSASTWLAMVTRPNWALRKMGLYW